MASARTHRGCNDFMTATHCREDGSVVRDMP